MALEETINLKTFTFLAFRKAAIGNYHLVHHCVFQKSFASKDKYRDNELSFI